MELDKKGWGLLISDLYSVLSEVQHCLEVPCTNLLLSLLENVDGWSAPGTGCYAKLLSLVLAT